MSSFNRTFARNTCLLYSEQFDVFSDGGIYAASAEVTFSKSRRSVKTNIWITGYSFNNRKKHNWNMYQIAKESNIRVLLTHKAASIIFQLT